ncbi:MAG: enoyl-CoA hydratase/isomerase family protein [Dehalococcoidia bacterium]
MAIDPTAFEDMALDEDADGVLTVTLNRPDSLNAMSVGMRAGLRRLPALVNESPTIRAVVLTGAGRGFCSGADMSANAASPYAPDGSRAAIERTRYGWVTEFRSISRPVIAAVNGVAAGGGLSLALACDRRVASEEARLGAIWVRRGLVPDMGASNMLVHLVGLPRALDMLWTGELVAAQQALAIGLVDDVCPAEELLDRAQAYARKLAVGPAVAITFAKRLAHYALDHQLAESADLEDLYQRMVSTTEDVREGRLSFVERRAPRFIGR